MLFHTPEFLGFLVVTLLLYYAAPRSRVLLLTVANAVFYGVVGLGWLALFAGMSLLTFVCTLGMRGSRLSPKLLLGIVIVVNLANLAFFKYTPFVLNSLSHFIGIQLIPEHSFWQTLVLPIGISFYTFQLIAYAVDVYKHRIEPERSVLRFWVFIAFFGHLVAGPIMRGHELIPQIEGLRDIRPRGDLMRLGLFYLGLGLAKKVLLSDYIAYWVDAFLVNPDVLTGPQAWTTIYLYAFQIYYDFSAYSDMAVGIGYLFGIELAQNFKTPYVSANATEFWRRWHITLSTWIKDYIYIPLGGSKYGLTRQCANLFAAMTISGIWHGAAWTFVVWGMFHGLLNVAHKLYTVLKKKLGITAIDNWWPYRIVCIVVFFHVICIGWVFFRIQGLQHAKLMLGKMLSPGAFAFPPELHGFLLAAAGLALLHPLEYLLIKHRSAIAERWRRYVPSPVRAVCYVAVLAVIVIYYKTEVSSFIYFQF